MKLIITADDYTAADCIDNGIEQAISKGCVNTVSALINNKNSLNKIKSLQSKNPDIKIGLHLTISSGSPILPQSEVNSLTRSSDDGRFMDIEEFDYYKIDIIELARELEAQIEVFLSSGINLDHLSCHHATLNIFEDFFKLYMSLGIKYNIPIRNPILISRQKINGFRWSVMKREGLSKAFKLIDDVGIMRLIRTSIETSPKRLSKRMIRYSNGNTRCPDFFIDTFYGNGSKHRLKHILKNVTKEAVSELVVHLADNSDCGEIPNGISKKYIKGRKKELKSLLKLNTKNFINDHLFLDWGLFEESKKVKKNPFFHN